MYDKTKVIVPKKASGNKITLKDRARVLSLSLSTWPKSERANFSTVIIIKKRQNSLPVLAKLVGGEEKIVLMAKREILWQILSLHQKVHRASKTHY